MSIATTHIDDHAPPVSTFRPIPDSQSELTNPSDYEATMTNTHSSLRSLRLGATIVASAALLTAPLVVPGDGASPLLPQAQAIPADGAGPNTPATSSDVWPKRIKPCERLNYKVGGYPAGETLNIKVDDGLGYSDTSTHGAGVVAQQAISSDGSARGSLDIPCNIGPGSHWLRFLASTEAGLEGGGYLGFTHRSPTFTIEAEGGGGGGSNDSGSDSDSSDSDSGSGSGGSNRGGGTSGGRSNSGGGVKTETVVVGGGRRSGNRTGETQIIEEVRGGGNRGNNRGSNNAGGNRSNSGSTGTSGSAGKGKNSLSAGKGKNGTKTIENTAGDGSGGTTKIVLSDDEERNSPFIGMMVGGSILLVGLLGIGAYLFVNRRRGSE